MKIKTTDLNEIALDWATATCAGQPRSYLVGEDFASYQKEGKMLYSTDWTQGGPIVEREGITVIRADDDYGVDSRGNCNNKRIPVWCASMGQNGTTESTEHQSHDRMYQIYQSKVVYGATPLIAAMRCFVASKLGEEVEIPEALCAELPVARRKSKMI